MQMGSVSCFSKDFDCAFKIECLTAILDMSSDVVVNADQNGDIRYLNSTAHKLIESEGDLDIFDDVYDQVQKEAIFKAIEHGYWQGETKYRTKEGAEGHLTQVILAHNWDSSKPRCFSSIVRDVTYQKKLDQREVLASNVLDNIIEGVVVTDAANTIINVNQAFTRVTGFKSKEVIGKKPSILSSGRHDRAFYEAMWNDLTEEGFWKGEIWNRHKSGNIYLQRLKIKAIRDWHGDIVNYVSLIEDITERKKLEEQIQFQAFHDSLTGLPNRYAFNKQLEEEIKSDRGEMAILLIDLDRFKRINDMLGYQAGDELLLAVADRLLRKVGEKGTVYRFEGNEFIVVYPGFDEREALKAADHILEEFRYSFNIQNHDFMIGACIGVSLYPSEGSDVDTLFKHANAALMRAKEFGSNSLSFFSEVTEHRSMEMLSLEDSLYWALEEDQFELYYQPQSDVCGGEITGYEVLVRWNHPEKGIVSPLHFIPIAEDTGLIQKLDELVLRKACNQMVAWSEQGFPPLRASVNLSMKNFDQKDIVTRVESIINETGIDPNQLTIELTESALMNNPDLVFHVLEAIKKKGIAIALDDFGTGYSSLSYLKRLPIDFLKIDRSFVRDITEDNRSAALVETIIQLAKSLGLQVISEGIETDEQLQQIRKYGCTKVQGYLIGRPLPRAQFEELLLQHSL